MKGQTGKKVLHSKLQRRLRNNMTDAEQRLWNSLRGRQMCGLKFRRQHPFGDYILDFVCLDAMLVIEVDGGQHAGRVGDDAVRSAVLVNAGFKVLRFWNNEVLCDIETVKEAIWRALQQTPSPPWPSP